MSFGSIPSEFCFHLNNFDVVPRGSGEAVSVSVKGHPQTLPNLICAHFQSQRQYGK